MNSIPTVTFTGGGGIGKKAECREIRDVMEEIELRAAPEGSPSPGTMTGYAAVFNRRSVDLGYFTEQIAPGAFGRAIARCDVRALMNHDPNQLLGRTSAGTLRLSEDSIGLRMEVDLPDTQLGRDVAALCRRGDLQGQSFSFTTATDSWDFSTDPAQRTLREVGDLYDVGPVTFPAYEETSVAMRSFQANKPSDPPPPAPDYSLEQARLRLLEVS